MPSAPLRYCSSPGCPERVPFGRCSKHTTEQRVEQRRHYTGTPGVNYGRKWQRARRLFLAEHPFCVDCEAEGHVIPATEVDHDTPHRGDARLFWDQTNWKPRCKPHHSLKTARETWHGA